MPRGSGRRVLRMKAKAGRKRGSRGTGASRKAKEAATNEPDLGTMPPAALAASGSGSGSARAPTPPPQAAPPEADAAHQKAAAAQLKKQKKREMKKKKNLKKSNSSSTSALQLAPATTADCALAACAPTSINEETFIVTN